MFQQVPGSVLPSKQTIISLFNNVIRVYFLIKYLFLVPHLVIHSSPEVYTGASMWVRRGFSRFLLTNINYNTLVRFYNLLKLCFEHKNVKNKQTSHET